MKSMKRALRRHHVARAKAKTLRFLIEVWRFNHQFGWTDEEIQRKVNKMHKNRAICSCHGCGNQRRYEGDSIQERRASESGAQIVADSQ